MKNVKYLKCINCGKIYEPVSGRYTCDDCGTIEGILDVVYDYDYISKICNKEYFLNIHNYSMWRYEPFLPVEKDGPKPKLRVGWSPLYKTDKLAEEIGLKTLYIKDDGINPTASLKDRASAIAVAKAMEENKKIICCSSTGNAASSLAGNAASCRIKTVIFVPQRAPQGKIAQLKIFGSNVISVKGSYNEAFKLSTMAIEKYGWYNRNAAINPYLMEGKKTVTLEICEQLNWKVPDWTVVSVGDGCTIAGIWKGYLDLYNTGFINKLPKLAGVQAKGCAPLTEAFFNNTKFKPSSENTIADSIAVGVPRNAEKALRAVRESKGTFINVTDEEILSAMRFLGSRAGIFGEPAGVAGFAGLKKLINEKIIDYNEMVVCIVTGNGLKDTNNAIKASGYPIEVEPDEKELFNVLENIEGLL
ncbi:threonine synthase [Caloramator sp. E03]|uniref:threonine synthase n=1 Tax=Caloramator sp. E03 TaxID=2576307 RepID=UPI001110F138|nr:threonine synthase [Caloramator sp. E03]QCX32750.1 threonine synthase [Caloramator sp. E03]